MRGFLFKPNGLLLSAEVFAWDIMHGSCLENVSRMWSMSVSVAFFPLPHQFTFGQRQGIDKRLKKLAVGFCAANGTLIDGATHLNGTGGADWSLGLEKGKAGVIPLKAAMG